MIRHVLSLVYRFKPGRTFAQALGATLGVNAVGVLNVDWAQSLSLAGMAGLLSFLMIWADGGDMLSDDQRVTGTKDAPAPPVNAAERLEPYAGDSKSAAAWHGAETRESWVDEREGGDTP